MPLTTNFSAEQTLGEPSIVTLTDTSSGSDVAVTQRRVYLQKTDGTYLVPSGTSTDYVQWPYADSEISIDALDKDYALLVIVQWLDVSNAVLYTKSILYAFSLYNEQFLYELTQAQAAEYPIVQDVVYYGNKMTMRVEVDSANQAVEVGGDQFSAQCCLDRATYMRLNSSKYF